MLERLFCASVKNPRQKFGFHVWVPRLYGFQNCVGFVGTDRTTGQPDIHETDDIFLFPSNRSHPVRPSNPRSFLSPIRCVWMKADAR